MKKYKNRYKNKNNIKPSNELEVFNVENFEITIELPKQVETPKFSSNEQFQQTLKKDNSFDKREKKKPKEKINKYEKRKLKQKKQEALLSLRGIHKFWTIHILLTLFIFGTEILVKAILNSLIFDYSLLRIFLSSNILSLILTIITTNLPHKIRKSILYIFAFLVSLYSWLQIGFTNFIGMFMSIGNAEQGTKITSYIIDFLCSYRLLMYAVWIPFIIFIIYMIFERNITKDGYNKKIEFKWFIYDAAMIVYFALLCFGFYVTIEVDFMQNKYQTVSNKSLFRYPSNPSLAVKNYGTTVYLFLDIKGLIIGGSDSITYEVQGEQNDKKETDLSRKIDDEAWENLIKIESDKNLNTLNNYFINRDIPDMNKYTGKFKNKNLIMIMLESVSEALFHDEYKEYYPTLNKLYHEGITGINNYSPRNNCSTGESEFTSQTSLYTIETTCTVNTYRKNEYQEALFYMLRKNGYYTSAYHNWNEQYYYRKTFENKFGSYRYYDADALNINAGGYYGSWPSDVTLFENALPKFIDQGRYASYLVTVSAHMPYKSSSPTGDKYLSMFKDTSFSLNAKRYLSKIKYVDLALEYLLKTLEESGKLEDTVIVLFGDHYPYGLSDKDFASIAPYDTKTNQEVDRTPFIIYNSKTEPEIITKYTTPLDYAPTILNLFGIEYDPRLYMGHDVFSDYNDYVVYADNSWQNGYGFYSASKGLFLPIDESNSLTDEEIIKINNEVNDIRTMSNLAIKKNYFNYLFKYFEEYAELKRQKEEELEASKDEEDSKKDTEEEER